MKTLAAVAAAAFMIAAGSAGACEWMKEKEQSVKAPSTSTVATLSGPQSTKPTTSK